MLEWLSMGLDTVIGRLGVRGLLILAALILGYLALWYFGYV